MTNAIQRDTGAARLPALQKVNIQDKALANWVNSVTERLQVREGERGNAQERAVTLRELRQAMGPVDGLVSAFGRAPGEGEIGIELAPGLTASVAVDKFAQSIIDSRLFKQLAQNLDDPTRFNHLAKEIRDELVKSIADEAAKRGAAIQDVQTIVQNNQRSFAMSIREITASLRAASAGVRQLSAAWSDGQQAMATNVLQLQASLGRYYSDGSAGKASLEQEMTVLASYADGLRAQYTLKVQAGGALAGFGLAAEEVNGKASSAFIIMADKFAIVSPSYTGGMMATPRASDVVFGVDGTGIYLQNNVYLKGNLRVDGTGKRLSDGLRGSLQIGASGSSWSDATASQAIYSALGNYGSAYTNTHLVIGDMVTISYGSTAYTRHWNGSAWVNPGAVINGDLLVDGTIAARKINTNGLTVKDNFGNTILSANGMDASWLKNLQASQVAGLGAMATQSAATIGSTVKFADGSTLGTWDFINRLSRINSGNIGTFMDVAAIGSAYIGNAAVGTLQIAGNSVTVPGGSTGRYWATVSLYAPQAGNYMVIGTLTQGIGRSNADIWYMTVNGSVVASESPAVATTGAMSAMVWLYAGYHTFTIQTYSYAGDARCGIVALGTMR
jgi:hypothetical protein